MPGLVPGIHAFVSCGIDVDGRDKPGHDDEETSVPATTASNTIALPQMGEDDDYPGRNTAYCSSVVRFMCSR
jgi:hypothetical protein